MVKSHAEQIRGVRDIEMQFIADKMRFAMFIYLKLNLMWFAVQASGKFQSKQAAGCHGLGPPFGVGLTFLRCEVLRVDAFRRKFAEFVAEVIHQMRW